MSIDIAETGTKWKIKALFFAGIILIEILVCGIVYLTGGTKYAYTHLMYIPIIIASHRGNIFLSLGSSIIGGWALALIPMSVAGQVLQEPSTRYIRIFIFIAMGFLITKLFRLIEDNKKNEIEKSRRNPVTDLPNLNKLLIDLEQLISEMKPFTVVIFRIMNADEIKRYINYDIGIKAIQKSIETFRSFLDNGRIYSIYSIYTHEFVALLPNDDLKDVYPLCVDYLKKFLGPVKIDGYSIEIVMKGGALRYPLPVKNAGELLKKLGSILDQQTDESNFSFYNEKAEERNKRKYEMTTALFNALRNDEFMIEYQPIINTKEKSVMGFEALIRWNHPAEGQVNPEEFIKLAEDMGMINDITKWVIKEVTNQIIFWRNNGIYNKVAINFSSKDLKNRKVFEYVKERMETLGIDPSLLEIELTERGIFDNNVISNYLLNEIRDMGIKVSLDDCGTGYNSLKNFIKMPIDYFKIDKCFVDNVLEKENKILIQNIVDFAHRTGRKVIAEGAENLEQVEALCEMGCDYIQGYYFSKPISPQAVEDYKVNLKYT